MSTSDPDEALGERAFEFLARLEEVQRALTQNLSTRPWINIASDLQGARNRIEGNLKSKIDERIEVDKESTKRWTALLGHNLNRKTDVDSEYKTYVAHLKSNSTPRSRIKRDRVKMILDEIYPNGVPVPSIVSNKQLDASVSNRLKERRLEGVSKETILRAAGRRTN